MSKTSLDEIVFVYLQCVQNVSKYVHLCDVVVVVVVQWWSRGVYFLCVEMNEGLKNLQYVQCTHFRSRLQKVNSNYVNHGTNAEFLARFIITYHSTLTT